ncbi:hypothetical protein GY45DRAFT_1317168 [Cubamyces sp. BRFM 1775]|nr:hypothetical protein GY45DRAFT_1317168 [Cubamyces sp. BRFM 1775]
MGACRCLWLGLLEWLLSLPTLSYPFCLLLRLYPTSMWRYKGYDITNTPTKQDTMRMETVRIPDQI